MRRGARRVGDVALELVGIDALGERRHVMVDGAPRATSALTLSHWPATPSPPELARDTSCEIALAALAARWRLPAAVDAATNDHLDEDGACALFVLCAPALAAAHGVLLAEAARAGDFDVVTSEAAGFVAWTLRALFDPERSPLAAGASRRGEAWTAHAYAEALAELPALLEHPGRAVARYGDEASAWRAGTAALATGRLRLLRDPELDFVIIEADDALLGGRFARIGHGHALPVHPAVLHGAAEESRVLVHWGDRWCYYDRYETWVRTVSRPRLLRRELGPLAAELSAAEPGAISWSADYCGTLVPVLAPLGGASDLAPEVVVAMIRRHLAGAPPAWDPSRRQGALLAYGATH
ncbi:MAG: hypothetical protein M0004_16310 [Actinomycetota bacterium]|nr:hypothetical protein [Actinomycetota bacterium]